MTDVVVRLEEPFARGSDAAARIVERPGGSAATFAVRLAQEGVAVDFVGRVGAADVERIAAEFESEGVTAWLQGDPNLPTGRLIALVEPGGERSFLTDRGANDALTLADIPRRRARRRRLAAPHRLHASKAPGPAPSPASSCGGWARSR